MTLRNILTTLLLLISFTIFGQNYMRDVGLRASDGIYLSYRKFFKEDMAIEGFIGYQENAIRIIAMREFFEQVLPQYSNNLTLVYGFGVHGGITYTNRYKIFYREYRKDDYEFSPIFGLDGLFGLEYQLPELPIMISLTVKPFFEYSISQYYRIDATDGAFTLRYRF